MILLRTLTALFAGFVIWMVLRAVFFGEVESYRYDRVVRWRDDPVYAAVHSDIRAALEDGCLTNYEYTAIRNKVEEVDFYIAKAKALGV